jgi:hypothetical protein
MALEPNGLADAMVAALPRAWELVKGNDIPFPGGSTDDAKIMFLAVARGLLTYLEAHQNDMIKTIDLDGTLTVNHFDVTALDLDTNVPA